ncbi:MAG: phage tail protein [Bacteroidetes bacterium]|nr:phage tail protein [Bacteroidota bacterium]
MALLSGLKYPSVGFHFIVRFEGIGTGVNVGPVSVSTADIDTRWTEVSGLNVEITTEELIEGGENRFTHKLPQRTKYPNLVLKRGYFSSLPSPLITWANDAINNLDIKPCQVQVMLLNEMHIPAQIWSFQNAYPVKLSMADLKATDNSFLIETLELTYQFFKKESLLDKITDAAGISI